MSEPYRYTNVDAGRTREQIEKILNRYDIVDVNIATFLSKNKIVCQFQKFTKIDVKTVPIVIQIIIPNVDEKNAKSRYRALFWYIKTKLESTKLDFLEFMQEWMPHILVKGKDGEMRTVYQTVLPRMNEALTGKGNIELLPPGEKCE